MPKLKTAVSDAREIAQILRRQYGFEEPKLLLNADATREKIMRALNELRVTMPDNGNLLIYYAGHGQFDREGKKSYWLPIDADPNDDTNWIMADEITTKLRTIPAKHILIVSDSCYSGGITLARAVESRWTPRDWDQYVKKMLREKSRTLMASGGLEPVEDEGGAGHSLFANALILGLNQMEQDSFPAMDLFQQFVRVRVAGRSEQTPEYNFIHDSFHVDGDFVFFRRRQTAQGANLAEESAPPKTTSGGDVLSHVERGKAFAAEKKNAEAEAEYRQVVKLEPNNALYRAYLGDALYNQQKNAEAEAEYRQAVRLEPNNILYRAYLGDALYNQKKNAEAEAEYRQAARLEPNNAQYRANLGNALYFQQKYADAEAEYKQAARLAPNVATYHYNVGEALFFQQRYAEAETEYRQAVRLEPNQVKYRNVLGDALLNQRKYPEAEQELKQAISLAPADTFLRHMFGRAVENQGKLAEAEAAYQEAVRLNPSYKEAQEGLARVRANRAAGTRTADPSVGSGGSRQNRGKVPPPPAPIQVPVMAGAGGDARAHIDRGKALADQQKYAEAEAEFTEATRLDP
ncbi:MAG TPA: tetratricopeptide repeat protein, partial [Candidatus Acidoferrales bacterium]|nr:tetratricopeptide repeat protein [Candidatus Acidoferrales bacterium]